jgi:hypothetical protein
MRNFSRACLRAFAVMLSSVQDFVRNRTITENEKVEAQTPILNYAVLGIDDISSVLSKLNTMLTNFIRFDTKELSPLLKNITDAAASIDTTPTAVSRFFNNINSHLLDRTHELSVYETYCMTVFFAVEWTLAIRFMLSDVHVNVLVLYVLFNPYYINRLTSALLYGGTSPSRL